MNPRLAPDLEAGYRQIREGCGLLESDIFAVSLSGPDAAEFLQGQVTNDVEAVEPGTGRYSLLLDRKGHIRAEMTVIRTGDETYWLLTAPESGPALEGHLQTYSVGHRVEVESRPVTAISIVGPACHEVIGTTPLGEYRSRPVTLAGQELLAIDTYLGLDLLPADLDSTEYHPGALVDGLLSAGAGPVTGEAVEIVRVERGRPRFGAEIDETNMPAEAGVVDRAVSFEKGCYIGQEPVARLHYKGRPNRHLRGLRFERPVCRGATVRSPERELGNVGSAVVSPAHGPIGLAILRREAGIGDEVTVGDDEERVSATVVDLPFPDTTGDDPT